MHQLTRIALVAGLLSIPAVAAADDGPSEQPAEGEPSAAAQPIPEPEREPADATETTEAQPIDVQPTEVERRILGFLDVNGDESIDPTEFERFPAPMKLWMAENGVDREQPLPRMEFVATLRTMMGDLRAGKHSRAFSSRGTETRRPAGAKPASKEPEVPKVDVSGIVGREAAYQFGAMDQKPRDGKLGFEEWTGDMKTWFESNKINIPREMDKDTFMQHYVRLRGRN